MTLDWAQFLKLPGAATRNWENLCRETVRRTYASFGDFRYVPQQPGVEFHLLLNQPCCLDSQGRHWGWQCRWYEIESGARIGDTRRKKIVDSLEKSKQYIPTLTDWVLCTRHPLSKHDQDWFYGNATDLKLHLFSSEDLEALLAGNLAPLRESYFGELALTPFKLARQHELSIAPIKKRWDPLLHVSIDAEKPIRRALGCPEAWPEIDVELKDLFSLASELETGTSAVDDADHLVLSELLASTRALAERLRHVKLALETCIERTRILVAEPVERPRMHWRRLDRKLRATSSPLVVAVTNALAAHVNVQAVFAKLKEHLQERLIAFVGDAGHGKTFVAAQLTAAATGRSAGIFLRAQPLARRGVLQTLFSQLDIAPADSVVNLLEGMNAAGARAGQRILLAIDGINESEDPREWVEHLATLKERLRDYPEILVLVTVRPSFATYALPDDITRFELPGFQNELVQAVRTYFKHYKIQPAGTDLDYSRFRNPLFLRIFCEAANPTRKRQVGVESLPTSMVDALERFVNVSVSRVAKELRVSELDVRKALDAVAMELWCSSLRTLDFDKVRALAGDSPRDWDNSIARSLVDEGILFRDVHSGEMWCGVLFDALGGVLIAEYLLRSQGERLLKSLTEETTSSKLDVDSPDAHPLAGDILSGLVSLTPKRQHKALWPNLRGTIQRRALLETIWLEDCLIDKETVDALAVVVALPVPKFGKEPLARICALVESEFHPLNCEFLDRVLRSLSVADRDARWTEWTRFHADELESRLTQLEERWRSTLPVARRDALAAQFVSWLLTATNRRLRDHATRVLYWYGQNAPASLFGLAIAAADINDPYVRERLLAASYGVAMCISASDATFVGALTHFLDELARQTFNPNATHPTNHWLIRDHIRGIFEVSKSRFPECLPKGVDEQFAEGPRVSPLTPDPSERDPVRGTIGMDFENYTIGGLFSSRQNYDMSHPDFVEAVADIRGRIWDLGWRSELFYEIDRRIGEDAYRRRDDSATVDRYGKKYGWIGYFEYAGQLEDSGRLPLESHCNRRLAEVSLDPSFPETPKPLPIPIASFLPSGPDNESRWLTQSKVSLPREFFRPKQLEGQVGPWICVSGFLEAKDGARDRRVFGIIHTFAVAMSNLGELAALLDSRPYPGNFFLPEEPQDHYTYASEFPWSDRFAIFSAPHEYSYKSTIEGNAGGVDIAIQVEVLCHAHAWETYHSALNCAGTQYLPSLWLAREMSLKMKDGSFCMVDKHGRLASVTYGPPQGHAVGHALYIREDVLLDYLARSGRAGIIFGWGERQIGLETRRYQAYNNIYSSHRNVWRQRILLDDLIGPNDQVGKQHSRQGSPAKTRQQKGARRK